MDYQEIYNKAAYAAINCKKDNVSGTQVNQLLNIFNSNAMKDIDNTLMLLMAFIMRQASRNLKDSFKKSSSNTIISTLNIIKNKNIEDDDKKSKTREFLGLLKWLYEVASYEKKEGKKTIKLIFIKYDITEDQSFNEIVKSFKNWATTSRKKQF